MRFRSVALPALLSAAALAAPAGAQGATLTATVDKPCYGTEDRVRLAGTGFTPSGKVTLMQGQRTLSPAAVADPAGNLGGRAIVQPIATNEEVAAYTATDETDPAIVASTQPIRFSRTTIVGTKAGDRGLIQRVRARGWTTGSRILYAHIRRGGRRVKDVRIGRLKGACRKLSVKRRLFSGSADPGRYPIFFDTYRRYRKDRRQQLRGTFTVRRFVTSSAAAWHTPVSDLRLARGNG